MITDTEKRSFYHCLYSDPSSWSLLTANVVAIFVIYLNGVTLTTVLWTYLIQSLIIGIFTFFQLITIKFTEPIEIVISGRKKILNSFNKIGYSFEFLIGFGIFHAIYVFFIVLLSNYGHPGPSDMAVNFVSAFREGTNVESVFFASLAFLISQIFSYFYNKKYIRPTDYGWIGESAFYRILPMHLFLIFGVYFLYQNVFLFFFLVLKTAIDLFSHRMRYGKLSNLRQVETTIQAKNEGA